MIDIFYFDKEVKKGSMSNIKKILRFPIWIDIVNITPEEAKFISEQFDIHPLTVDDLVTHKTRIKVEEFNKYLFCVFYGIANIKSHSVEELDFILGDKFLITHHHAKFNSIEEFKKKPSKMENLFVKHHSFVFHNILDMEIDNFFPVLTEIDAKIETAEENIAKKVDSKYLHDVLTIKKELRNIKKFVLPQREKLSLLSKGDSKFIPKKVIPYIRDIYDHSVKVADQIENNRDAVSSAYEAYMSAVSNNMNEVMKTLSIIATLAMPLSVISGIYGTNFTVLPGQGVPYGFWIMIGVMVSFVIGMLIMFKKNKWF